MRKSNDFSAKTFKCICMKIIYLPLIVSALLLSSCSSSYKTAQSTNDPYYSTNSQNQNSGSDQYYNANSDDQYLMMKSQDPTKWSYFDDYAYDGYYAPTYGMYNPYAFGYSPFGYSPFGYSPFGLYGGFGYSPFMSFGYGYYGPTYLNNYYMWNGFYNPYYSGVVVVTKYPSYNYYTQLHPFTLTSYTGTAISNGNSFRNSFSNGNRTTSVNNNYRRFSTNSTNSTNNFFRSQNVQSQSSFRSFSPSSSFGGGGRVSFGRR